MGLEVHRIAFHLTGLALVSLQHFCKVDGGGGCQFREKATDVG